MFRILRKQRLTKVCSLEVTVFISFHVSDPYNNTNLTLLLMIRSLAPVDILLFFHTVRKHHLLFEFIQDILCSTPIFITHTARYVKMSTYSILSPLKVNWSFCVCVCLQPSSPLRSLLVLSFLGYLSSLHVSFAYRHVFQTADTNPDLLACWPNSTEHLVTCLGSHFALLRWSASKTLEFL